MRIALTVAALVALSYCGCNKTDTNNTPVTPNTSGERSNVSVETHADGSECTCEHGPNHGHVFDFDNANYKGEWVVSKDNDVVRFYLLDANKSNTNLKVDDFKVISSVGSDSATFELEPEKPNADGSANAFMSEDKDLRIALRMGVSVEVKSGDMTLKGTVAGHEPHDHDH